jgi:hypothetical protein
MECYFLFVKRSLYFNYFIERTEKINVCVYVYFACILDRNKE